MLIFASNTSQWRLHPERGETRLQYMIERGEKRLHLFRSLMHKVILFPFLILDLLCYMLSFWCQVKISAKWFFKFPYGYPTRILHGLTWQLFSWSLYATYCSSKLNFPFIYIHHRLQGMRVAEFWFVAHMPGSMCCLLRKPVHSCCRR